MSTPSPSRVATSDSEAADKYGVEWLKALSITHGYALYVRNTFLCVGVLNLDRRIFISSLMDPDSLPIPPELDDEQAQRYAETVWRMTRARE